MAIQGEHLMSVEEFKHHLDQPQDASSQGPIAVSKEDEIVGVFISPTDYEAMFGIALRDLLAKRGSGRTFSQEEARRRLHEVIRRHETK